jgi:hypothetical protein
VPRITTDAQVTTKAARERLPAQHEPHWRGIEGGLAIGYRKSSGGGMWFARLRIKARYAKVSLGRADDAQTPDGERVLDFRQAQSKALVWAARQQRIASGEEAEPDAKARRAYTVADAMADYLADYKARDGKALKTTRNAIDAHIIPALGNTAVGRLTKIRLRDWHRALAAAAPRRRRAKSDTDAKPSGGHLEKFASTTRPQ